MKLNPADAELLSQAVQALKHGDVIGMPTETVYGLAADAMNISAVAKIFALKGRPADHPLIVHIADISQLPKWAVAIPEEAYVLAQHFWPGPLTMILRKHAGVPDEVTGGQDTVGLRCPAHPLALVLLQQFDGGVAAPSANRFGRISPTTALHVRDEFGDAVPVILDGGECEVGIESTIIDLSSEQPRLLRPGMISQDEIEAVIGPIASNADTESPRVSGSLAAHYAPRTPMQMLTRKELLIEYARVAKQGLYCEVLCLDDLPDDLKGLSLSNEYHAYAHGLYAAMRDLDSRNADLLLIEQIPQTSEWLAVNDRLGRALVGAGVDDIQST
ncbi:MAG: L-threonylcarbamoyladenylate synthase [Arenimonas sp.]